MNTQMLKQAILKTHSRSMTVVFTKANGEERTMHCKTGVKRFLDKKPNKKVFKPNEGVIKVFDCESKSYKSFNINSIKSFKCGNVIIN